MKVLRSRTEASDCAVTSSSLSKEWKAQEGDSSIPSPSDRGSDSSSCVADEEEREDSNSGDLQPSTARCYIVRGAHYYKYSLPLKQPLTSEPTKAQREGLILRLTVGRPDANDKACFEVCGEIAPLPGIKPRLKASIL